MIKVHILLNIVNSASGGGNSFLRRLKNQFIEMGIYEDDITKADIIYFNSHHLLQKVFMYKKQFPNKVFIHRVDGTITKVRGYGRMLDSLIVFTNNYIADGTIFQSEWTRAVNRDIGMSTKQKYVIINNACNQNVFYAKRPHNNTLSIIISSWSNNINKGFNFYELLDKYIEKKDINVTFMGNSPIKFKNIKMIPPLNEKELANELRKHDIYLTASKNDPCSNAVVEALSCKLPVVYYRSGGHPELVKKGGLSFITIKGMIKAIYQVKRHIVYYQSKIKVNYIDKVALDYYKFGKKIYNSTDRKKVNDDIKQELFVKQLCCLGEEKFSSLKEVLHKYNNKFGGLR